MSYWRKQRKDGALKELGKPRGRKPVDRRHRDLYQYTTRSLHLPITSLSLKDIAEYHGIRKISSVRDGMEGDILYHQYRTELDPTHKTALREQLIDHNRGDLDALVTATEQVGTLSLS